MMMLWFLVNPLTAVLTFGSLIGYAVIYTVFLKRATPQNIVIGGAAGAAPPVLGWTAVTGEMHSSALLLFLIIFVWTPPHFWALAIARKEEYAKVGIPMLPVTHGEAYTRLHIFLYTILLVVITIMPYLTGMSGLIYLAAAVRSRRISCTTRCACSATRTTELPMKSFSFSITYLGVLFAALLVDHYFLLQLNIEASVATVRAAREPAPRHRASPRRPRRAAASPLPTAVRRRRWPRSWAPTAAPSLPGFLFSPEGGTPDHATDAGRDRTGRRPRTRRPPPSPESPAKTRGHASTTSLYGAQETVRRRLDRVRRRASDERVRPRGHARNDDHRGTEGTACQARRHEVYEPVIGQGETGR